MSHFSSLNMWDEVGCGLWSLCTWLLTWAWVLIVIIIYTVNSTRNSLRDKKWAFTDNHRLFCIHFTTLVWFLSHGEYSSDSYYVYEKETDRTKKCFLNNNENLMIENIFHISEEPNKNSMIWFLNNLEILKLWEEKQKFPSPAAKAPKSTSYRVVYTIPCKLNPYDILSSEYLQCLAKPGWTKQVPKLHPWCRLFFLADGVVRADMLLFSFTHRLRSASSSSQGIYLSCEWRKWKADPLERHSRQGKKPTPRI